MSAGSELYKVDILDTTSTRAAISTGQWGYNAPLPRETGSADGATPAATTQSHPLHLTNRGSQYATGYFQTMLVCIISPRACVPLATATAVHGYCIDLHHLGPKAHFACAYLPSNGMTSVFDHTGAFLHPPICSQCLGVSCAPAVCSACPSHCFTTFSVMAGH